MSTRASGASNTETLMSISQHLTCPICMDMLEEPVTTSCGHTFCKKCLIQHLSCHKSCPLCKQNLLQCPAINVNFKALLEEHCKTHELCSDGQVPYEVCCDMCPNNGKCKAIKSCLTCLMSYCEYHLKRHQSKLHIKGHKLVAPVKDLDQRSCQVHGRPLELYCSQQDKCICSLCVEEGTEVISVEDEKVKRMKTLANVIKDMQQRMQQHQEKIKEFQYSAKTCMACIKQEKNKIKEVFEAVRKVVREAEEEVLHPLQEKARYVEQELKYLTEELQKEITMFKNTIHKIEKITDEEDHIMFLQNYMQLVPPSENGKNWTDVTIDTHMNLNTMRNMAVNMKVNIEAELNKLSSVEIERIKKYSASVAQFVPSKQKVTVDVMLNPSTCNAQLLVSEDMKEVQDSGERRDDVPDSSNRFDLFGSILGCSQLPRDKAFWVVDVGDKQGWDIGVAKEKANRKGNLSIKPSQGYWAIVHYNGDQYAALEDLPVPLLLPNKPKKVGVFVDQKEGLVSFYDMGAKTHIYSFTGCVFEDTILPYFSPHLKQGEKNSSPLVICPVNFNS